MWVFVSLRHQGGLFVTTDKTSGSLKVLYSLKRGANQPYMYSTHGRHQCLPEIAERFPAVSQIDLVVLPAVNLWFTHHRLFSGSRFHYFSLSFRLKHFKNGLFESFTNQKWPYGRSSIDHHRKKDLVLPGNRPSSTLKPERRMGIAPPTIRMTFSHRSCMLEWIISLISFIGPVSVQ